MAQADGFRGLQHRCYQHGCDAAFDSLWDLNRHLREKHNFLQSARRHESLMSESTSISPTTTSPTPSRILTQRSVSSPKDCTLESSTPASMVVYTPSNAPTTIQKSQAPDEVVAQPSTSYVKGDTVETLNSSSTGADTISHALAMTSQALGGVLAPPITGEPPMPISPTANNFFGTPDLLDPADLLDLTNAFDLDGSFTGHDFFDDSFETPIGTGGNIQSSGGLASSPMQTSQPYPVMSSRDCSPAGGSNQANKNQTLQPLLNSEAFQTPRSCPSVPVEATNPSLDFEGMVQPQFPQAWSNIAMNATQISRAHPTVSSRESTPYSDSDTGLDSEYAPMPYPWLSPIQTRQSWPDYLPDARHDLNPRSVPSYSQDTAMSVPRYLPPIDHLGLTNPSPEPTDINSTDDEGRLSNPEEGMTSNDLQRMTGRKRKRSATYHRIVRARQAMSQNASGDSRIGTPVGGHEDPWSILCEYCHAQRYEKINSFWAHIYHKHKDVDQADRTKAIRESAATLLAHWQTGSKTKKRSRTTLCRMETAASATFSWADVIRWNL